MDAWLAGYEHDTAEADAGAGLNVLAGADKVVLHTTESPRGSYGAVRALWRGTQNWGRGLPHFIQDGARFVQLLPLTVNAYTLANPPGPPDTNRSGHVIQVERCGYAAQPMADDEYDACGRWLADLVRAGLGIDLAQHPRFYGAGDGIVLATVSSPIRLSAAAYDAFNGYLGHQHVPQNDHWDPGGIDGPRLETIARNYLGQTPTPIPEDDMPYTPDQLRAVVLDAARQIVRDPATGGVYILDEFGMTRSHLGSPDDVIRAHVELGVRVRDDGAGGCDLPHADVVLYREDGAPDAVTAVDLGPVLAAINAVPGATVDEIKARL